MNGRRRRSWNVNLCINITQIYISKCVFIMLTLINNCFHDRHIVSSWASGDAVLLSARSPSSCSTKSFKCNEKSAQRDANTAHCPDADPFPGGTGWPKFNQLEMVTTFTYKPSLLRIDARNFELSW